MTRHQGTITHLQKIARADAMDNRVAIPWSDIGAAGNNFVALNSFSYFDSADAIQSLA